MKCCSREESAQPLMLSELCGDRHRLDQATHCQAYINLAEQTQPGYTKLNLTKIDQKLVREKVNQSCLARGGEEVKINTFKI